MPGSSRCPPGSVLNDDNGACLSLHLTKDNLEAGTAWKQEEYCEEVGSNPPTFHLQQTAETKLEWFAGLSVRLLDTFAL